jgi:hypothetical protein
MEYIKIISSLGIGALGMYFMFELCKRLLSEMITTIKDINQTMQKQQREQHEEHREIIRELKELRKQ